MDAVAKRVDASPEDLLDVRTRSLSCKSGWVPSSDHQSFVYLDRFWSLVTDALTPQQANELGDDLGIEQDTAEHGALEKGRLCSTGSVLGKRRR